MLLTENIKSLSIYSNFAWASQSYGEIKLPIGVSEFGVSIPDGIEDDSFLLEFDDEINAKVVSYQKINNHDLWDILNTGARGVFAKIISSELGVVRGQIISYNSVNQEITIKTESGVVVIKNFSNIKTDDFEYHKGITSGEELLIFNDVDRVHGDTMQVQINSKKAGKYKISGSYLIETLSWNLTYSATLKNGQLENIQTFINIYNSSQSFLHVDRLVLVSGDVQRARNTKTRRAYLESSRSPVAKKLHQLYEFEVVLPAEGLDLFPSKNSKKIPWITIAELNTSKVFDVLIENGRNNADVVIEGKNETNLPLLPGKFKIMWDAGILGEDFLDWVDPSSKFRVSLGKTPAVWILSSRKYSLDRSQLNAECVVHNSKNEKIEMQARIYIPNLIKKITPNPPILTKQEGSHLILFLPLIEPKSIFEFSVEIVFSKDLIN